VDVGLGKIRKAAIAIIALFDKLQAYIARAVTVGEISKAEARKRRAEIARLDNKIADGHADYADGLEHLKAIGNAIHPKRGSIEPPAMSCSSGRLQPDVKSQPENR
jgi:hypothetical protein